MPDPLFIGALVVGFFLLSNNRGDQPQGAPLSGFLSGFRPGPGGGSGDVVGGSGDPGILAASGDEDIGIFPAPGIADPFTQSPTAIRVASSNTPVISSSPARVPVVLGGSFTGGFNLTGPGSVNLTPDTPIRVTADAVANPFVFSEFSSTPAVLAAYLSDPLGPAAPATTKLGQFAEQTFAESLAQSQNEADDPFI